MVNEIIKKLIKENINIVQHIYNDQDLHKEINNISQEIICTLENNHKVLFFGNGGSAADSQHVAGEFISKFLFERSPLAGISLTGDSSVITSISNDIGFEYVFSRQIEGLGKEGDIAFAISTSGNSPNVIEGLKKAKEIGLKTIGFTGLTGGNMKNYCDHIIKIPSNSVPRIQESHILIIHLICQIVENQIFKNDKK